MITKEDLTRIVQDASKDLSKARRFVENAARNLDPSRNAELMHSLQEAQQQLEDASARLQRVADALSALSAGIDLLVPADEKPLAVGG